MVIVLWDRSCPYMEAMHAAASSALSVPSDHTLLSTSCGRKLQSYLLGSSPRTVGPLSVVAFGHYCLVWEVYYLFTPEKEVKGEIPKAQSCKKSKLTRGVFVGYLDRYNDCRPYGIVMPQRACAGSRP